MASATRVTRQGVKRPRSNGHLIERHVGERFPVEVEGEGWRKDGNKLVPYPIDGAMRVIVVGPAGQGKTTLVTALLRNDEAWARIFRRVYVVSPTAAVDRYKDLGIPPERFLEPTDAAVLQKISEWDAWLSEHGDNWSAEDNRGNLADMPKACFIFDDLTGTDIPKGAAIKLLCSTMRKRGLSVIWVANRVYDAIPTCMREQATAVLAFYGPKALADSLANQFCPMEWTTRMFLNVYAAATRGGQGHFLAILPNVPDRSLMFTGSFETAYSYE